MILRKRLILSALVFVLGVVSFIYGGAFNSTTVLAEDEDKPGTVSATQLTEWVINRDVTVGGLVRNASGAIKRTYSGQPPSLCPT